MSNVYLYCESAAQAQAFAGFCAANGLHSVAVVFDAALEADYSECGADELLVVDGDGMRPEDYAASLCALMEERGAALFLCASSPIGRELAASVAARKHCPMVSDAVSLECADGALKTTRMVNGGLVTLDETIEGFCVVTAGSGVGEPVVKAPEVSHVTLDADTRVKVVEVKPLPKKGVDLTKAERVVCVGNGLAEESDMSMVRELAAALGAEIGCSRGIAEERKWLPQENYIGISGAILNSKLYLSAGVSGAVQHTYGIRASKVVAAIDKNKDALIFGEADYCLVGDLYEIMPELIKVFS